MTRFQPFHDLAASQREALKRDIEVRGIVAPVVEDEHGNIIDGHQRRSIAAELHIDYPKMVVEGLDDDEKMALAISLNTFRRHLTGVERSQAIQKMSHLGMSVRRIAAATGVPRSTVQDDLSGVRDRTPEDRVLGADGKSYPAAVSPAVAAARERREREAAEAAALAAEGMNPDGEITAPRQDEGAGSTTPDPAPSDPDAKNRAVIDSALVALNNVRRDLAAERVRTAATPEQRDRIDIALDLTRRWCDDVEIALSEKPNLKAV